MSSWLESNKARMANISDILSRKQARREGSLGRLGESIKGLSEISQRGKDRELEAGRPMREAEADVFRTEELYKPGGTMYGYGQAQTDWEADAQLKLQKGLREAGLDMPWYMGRDLSDEDRDKALAMLSAGRTLEVNDDQGNKWDLGMFYAAVGEVIPDGWIDIATGNINYQQALAELMQLAEYQEGYGGKPWAEIPDLEKKKIVRQYIYDNYKDTFYKALEPAGIVDPNARLNAVSLFQLQFGEGLTTPDVAAEAGIEDVGNLAGIRPSAEVLNSAKERIDSVRNTLIETQQITQRDEGKINELLRGIHQGWIPSDFEEELNALGQAAQPETLEAGITPQEATIYKQAMSAYQQLQEITEKNPLALTADIKRTNLMNDIEELRKEGTSPNLRKILERVQKIMNTKRWNIQ